MRQSPRLQHGFTLPEEPAPGVPLYDLLRCPMCRQIFAVPEGTEDPTCPGCGLQEAKEPTARRDLDRFEAFGKRTREEIRQEFLEGVLYGVIPLPDGWLEISLGAVPGTVHYPQIGGR